MTADEILQKILSDGVVDAQEVEALKKMVNEDWVIDQDEVELLFRVNVAVGNNDEKCPEWTDFFVSSVVRMVVGDMDSPGNITEDEGNWLGPLMQAHSMENKSQEKLIFELQNTTTSIEGQLGEWLKPFDQKIN